MNAVALVAVLNQLPLGILGQHGEPQLERLHVLRELRGEHALLRLAVHGVEFSDHPLKFDEP
jgi:hypothetical protein